MARLEHATSWPTLEGVHEMAVPIRSHGRRRDRRGRGLRGPLIPPLHPAHLTRREAFDVAAAQIALHLSGRLPIEIGHVEVAVEDVPPSEPAPWEQGTAPMSRAFPADRFAGSAHRIVLYRRVIEQRESDVTEALYQLLAFHLGELAGVDPDALLD